MLFLLKNMDIACAVGLDNSRLNNNSCCRFCHKPTNWCTGHAMMHAKEFNMEATTLFPFEEQNVSNSGD